MEIGSIIDILRTLPEGAALKTGDLLNVKVLEVFENQRAMVDLGRFRAMAEITFPVAAGDELRVKVRETEGRLSLQLVPSPGGPASRAAGPVPAAVLLNARLAVLTSLFKSGVGRSLVQDRRELAGLARAAAELLADIRTGQEQLAKAHAEAHSFQTVHFALPMPDARCRAELKIGYGRRPAAGREEGYRAAILLELDRMGAVRADLILQGRHLNVAIFVSEARMRDLVHRHASEVMDALAPFFERVAFQASVSPRKIAAFAGEEWRAPGETQVDVRV